MTRFQARLLLCVFLTALLLRVGLAMRVPSMAHPDEIFQTQEAAHRLAYGYRIVTWEGRDERNLTIYDNCRCCSVTGVDGERRSHCLFTATVLV
jgi:hypothetical protein